MTLCFHSTSYISFGSGLKFSMAQYLQGNDSSRAAMSTAHSKLHLTDDIEVDDGFGAARALISSSSFSFLYSKTDLSSLNIKNTPSFQTSFFL